MYDYFDEPHDWGPAKQPSFGMLRPLFQASKIVVKTVRGNLVTSSQSTFSWIEGGIRRVYELLKRWLQEAISNVQYLKHKTRQGIVLEITIFID